MLYDNYVVLKVILSSKQLKLVYKKKKKSLCLEIKCFQYFIILV